jgi:hypothetical protein
MIEMKKELITKWASGTHLSDLAAQYGMAKLTISTILKIKEAIKVANVAKGVKTIIEIKYACFIIIYLERINSIQMRKFNSKVEPFPGMDCV